MILNLDFRNFRSFSDDCSFTAEPTRSLAKRENLCDVSTNGEGVKKALLVSVIFGANASGKSSIVRILHGMRCWVRNQGVSDDMPIPLYIPFRFDADSGTKPVDFSLEFVTNGLRYLYTVQFDRYDVIAESLDYYPEGKPVNLYRRVIEGAEPGLHTIDLAAEIEGVTHFRVFHNQLLLSKFLLDTPVPVITDAARYISSMVVSCGYHEDLEMGLHAELYRWLANKPEYIDLLSELLRFADTGLEAFRLVRHADNYDVVGLHHRYRNGEKAEPIELPMEQESFGTRALFALGCRILQSLHNGAPFFADEMDSGMHPIITRMIIDIYRNRRINAKGAQLVFTTHDVNVLDHNHMRKDQIWFVSKDRYGASELFSLSDFEDVTEDTPFGKWYLNNKFGATPYIQPLENLFAGYGQKE